MQCLLAWGEMYRVYQCLLREIKSTYIKCDLALFPLVKGACIREWLQGGARLPTTHTLVKLTLCNGCYLIIENGRGRNQVSLCWGGKTGSAAAAGRLLASYWLRSCCRIISALFNVKLVLSTQQNHPELVMVGVRFHLRERKRQGIVRSRDGHRDRRDKD